MLQTRIYLQRSAPIQPKTRDMLLKIYQILRRRSSLSSHTRGPLTEPLSRGIGPKPRARSGAPVSATCSKRRVPSVALPLDLEHSSTYIFQTKFEGKRLSEILQETELLFTQSENGKKSERKNRTDLFQLHIFHISLKCSNRGITPVKITEILRNSKN